MADVAGGCASPPERGLWLRLWLRLWLEALTAAVAVGTAMAGSCAGQAAGLTTVSIPASPATPDILPMNKPPEFISTERPSRELVQQATTQGYIR